jgi:Asp-tRNA(Asn)/Glu-tRNA(Gln) amidotransferase C subunit
MNDFEKKRNSLPKKKKKLENLQAQLNKFEKDSNLNDYTTEDIKKRADLKTEITNLKEEIYDIEHDVSELDYYYKTEDIIMDYYGIIEMGDNELYEQHPELGEIKNTSKDKEIDMLEKLTLMNLDKKKKVRVTKKRKRTNPTKSNSIMDFMGNLNEVDLENTETVNCSETETETNFGNIIEDDSKLSKAKLLDQYMTLIDSNYSYEKSKEYVIKKCTICNIEKTLIQSEGIYVCQKCGDAEMVIIDAEKPNYKDAVSDSKPSYPYKKSNHLSLSLIEYILILATEIYIKIW